MEKKLGFGFLTLAIGKDRYLRQAETLALSLRSTMPKMPIAVVTDRPEKCGYADYTIPVNFDYPIGTVQKILIWDYSPFEKTLFIDSDCVATRDFHSELLDIQAFNFSPAMEKLVHHTGSDEYVEDLSWTLQKIGGSFFPKFNGGVYYFDRSAVARNIFLKAQEYFRDWQSLGIRKFDAAGPGDETVLALAMSHYDYRSLYFDKGRLMRTPTGINGSLSIDVGKGCSFVGREGLVEPAICHFAGKYLFRPEYYMLEYSVRYNVPIPQITPILKFYFKLKSTKDRALKYLSYKVHGLKKRLKKR